MLTARSVRIRGVVQGVGFRPYVFRLAKANALAGWVLNGENGVEIHLEGGDERLDAFLRDLATDPPPAAAIAAVDVQPAEFAGLTEFTIRESERGDQPTVRMSPDLAVCERCLTELFEPSDPRYHYPYINCTDCGPRYSIIQRLPYDRAATTMAPWAMDDPCSQEYHDPTSRRFHAQPTACPACGPHIQLLHDDRLIMGDDAVVKEAAALLMAGDILAIKGLGGYHLACDAKNEAAVSALRERKYRKEKPFAVMARDLSVARRLAIVSSAAESLLTSPARPIVLLPRLAALVGVAPDNLELGVMLPYTPLHHLLFAAGAPEALVMTSGNRSSEPIAVGDDEAMTRLGAIADGFLIGERPIARRVEDSVVRATTSGPVILRRGRGYAPGVVATLPSRQPILALGADLKNTVTLVVAGQAFVGQHIGDLDHYQAFEAFTETINDLVGMYDVAREELLLVRDLHPQYCSTRLAHTLGVPDHRAIQHHRAHIASVLAERGAWEQRVLGVSLDGTGYGDDGTIWGGELFVGSVVEGLTRVAHLRPAALVGGDAAARYPVQAAVGFLAQLPGLPELREAPFRFSKRYQDAVKLMDSGTRTFQTTSMGRLFDATAALLGFTRAVTYEGQAAIWLEQLAARIPHAVEAYPFPFAGEELDFRPLLTAVIEDRLRDREPAEIARAFHLGIACGLRDASLALSRAHKLHTVVASGGVFQNRLLLQDFETLLEKESLEIWGNQAVPPNDGGISLGQAALAAFGQFAAA